MAPDLVGRKVDVIIAMGGTPSALAMKSATSIALATGETRLSTQKTAAASARGSRWFGKQSIGGAAIRSTWLVLDHNLSTHRTTTLTVEGLGGWLVVIPGNIIAGSHG
jgi:hypothetical protein